MSASWVARRVAITVLLATVTVALVILLPASFSVSAQVARPSEAELKAAFVYNFIKFTEWPAEEMANKSEPFVIGVLGKDPFGAVLDKTIEGESFQQRPIVVRRFSRMDESVGNSQVLFIGASEGSNLPAILKLLDGQAILTVSEIENFAQRGGVIKLAKESNKLVFEINVDAAKRAGLAMSVQLLRLAKIVKRQS
ncbi:MAG: YfiR family protein [Candidatus Binatia bacterium]